MKKIAVTGSLASGKSTVCNILKKHGGYVVSADEIVHQLLSPKTTVGKKVIALLGQDVIKEGKIDREIIAKSVFTNQEKLRALEEIIHPAVLEEIDLEFRQIKNNQNYSFFIAEIPLLFEKHWNERFDTIIAVIAKKDLCKERYQKMKSLESSDFERRMARQMPEKIKAEKATFTLVNEGSLEELHKEIKTLIPKLT